MELGVKRVIVEPTVMLPFLGEETSMGKAFTGSLTLLVGQATMKGEARV